MRRVEHASGYYWDFCDFPLADADAEAFAASPVPDPARRQAQRPLLHGDIPSPAAPPSGCVFRTRCPLAEPACALTVPALREIAPGHWRACLRDPEL